MGHLVVMNRSGNKQTSQVAASAIQGNIGTFHFNIDMLGVKMSTKQISVKKLYFIF